LAGWGCNGQKSDGLEFVSKVKVQIEGFRLFCSKDKSPFQMKFKVSVGGAIKYDETDLIQCTEF